MLKPLLISGLLVLCQSCATPGLQKKLQGDGPTSIELYRQQHPETLHQRSLDNVHRARQSITQAIRYQDYTREAGNEIEQLFPRLPNPRLVIYVFPHLSTRDNAPVPGYSTAVNLYEKDEYALPHEIPGYGRVPHARGER